MQINNLVSIVMTYYNRLGQLKKTLTSFQKHGYTNFEVIIVDDGSDLEPISDKLLSCFEYPIEVIKMPLIKTYSNPSIAYNAGFSIAKGEIIIIQNSECLHVDNILEHARVKVNDENYITYACFSLSKNDTIQLLDIDGLDLQIVRKKIEDSIADADAGMPVWKNHSKYRANALHFTSAIKKSNLDKIGGFDQRYAKGTSFDDEEILIRIKRIPLEVLIKDNLRVVHQWHGNQAAGISDKTSKFRLHKLHLKNQFLLKYVTKLEKDFTNNQRSFYFLIYKSYAPFCVFFFALIKTLVGKLKINAK
jgi:glycosyltransferase involved in cell wall biosynthesis